VSGSANDAGSIAAATVRLNEESNLIVDILFSRDVADATQISQINHYLLLDIESGRFVPIVDVLLKVNQNNAQLLLDPTIRITKDSKLHLFIRDIRLKGDLKPETLSSPVSVRLTQSPDQHVGLIKDKGSEHLLTAAKGKDDSDVYLSGQANGASSQKFTYTADVKLSFPFKVVQFSRVNTFAPVFTYNASTDPKANPDTLNLGLDWSLFPVRDLAPSPFTRLQLTNSPKLEGTHNLDAFNFVHSVRSTFLSRVARKGIATFYALPYVGQEIGTSISSPLVTAEGNLIARPFAGGDFNLVFDVNKGYLKNISLESYGVRRWLLRDEVDVDTDKSGKITAINSNTKPKDYVKNSLTFGLSDYWGLTLSHEYGRLPPIYKLLDNKMTVGLTYKVSLNKKAILK